MDPQLGVARLAEPPERGVLRVVDCDRSVEAAGEAGGDDPEPLELALGGASHQSTGDEQRLAFKRRAGSHELVRSGLERLLAGIVRRARKRQLGWLDHDRRAAAPTNEGLERLPRERE